MSEGRGLLPEWRCWPGVVLAALLAVAILGFVFVHVSHGNEIANGAANPKANQWPIPWDWITSAAFWTAIFTGALTWYNTRLWRETRRLAQGAETQSEQLERSIAAAQKSADTAEKALTVLERPYLFIISVGFDGFNAAAKLHNYGRTPANIVEFRAYLRILDRIPRDGDEIYEGPDAARVQEPIDIDVIIGQSMTWTAPGTMCINGPRPEHNEPLKAGTMHYYVWGEVIYRDVFRNTHQTAFCRQLQWGQANWVPVGGMDRNYGT